MVDELLAEQTELAEQPDGDAILYIEQGGVQYHIQASNLLLGAAPAAQYVTLATDSVLANERVLTGTTNQIIVTDNGAGGTVVLSVPQDIHTSATPTFGGIVIAGDGTIGQAAGPLLTFDDDNNYLEITGCDVGIGTTTPTAKFHVAKGYGDIAADSKCALLFASYSPSAAAGNKNIWALYVQALANATTQAITGAVYGSYYQAYTAGSNAIAATTAFYALVEHYGSGQLDYAYGMRSTTFARAGAGRIYTNYSFLSTIYNQSASNIDYAYDFYSDTGGNTGAGNILNKYGLYVEAQTIGSTSNYAIYTNAGQVRFGDYVTIDQASSTGAQPVLLLDQADISEGFINFVGTSAASAAGPISTWAAGNSIQGFVRVEINGTGYWMPYYDAPTE